MTTTDTSATAGTDTGSAGTQTTTDDAATGATDTTTTSTADTTDEVAKWKALARKHEDRAKANDAAKKELEKLQAAQMTDTEKAIADAVAKARAEVMAEVGSSLVDAEFKAASAGFTLDVDALLENLDRRKFMGDDGKPDKARIGEFVTKLAPAKRSAATDTGQGARKDGNGAAQITDLAELHKMTPEQIVKAREEGRLSTMLRG